MIMDGRRNTKDMHFPYTINKTFVSLYGCGITGWGEKYELFFTTAEETVEQIKLA